jgi:hypothetical protein
VTRHPQWDQRLVDCVSELRAIPHDWGKHDCLLWVAAAVKAVTGKDHARGHRGKYKNRVSAYRYLKSLGYDSPEAMIDSALTEKPVGFAQRGDLVMASDGIPAVCMGAVAFSVGEEGLVSVPREQWAKAWGVG